MEKQIHHKQTSFELSDPALEPEALIRATDTAFSSPLQGKRLNRVSLEIDEEQVVSPNKVGMNTREKFDGYV